MEKIAAIDIGSNTLRLLIGLKEGKRLKPIHRDREIVRLGRNFYPDCLLSQEAIQDALKVLKRFKRRADQEEVSQILTVGTGVLRAAKNSHVFLATLEKENGLAVKIISGPHEARIMAKGVLSVVQISAGKNVIFDIGGGSTEFVTIEEDTLVDKISIPLGVVGLFEEFLLSDPPAEKEIEILKAHCRNILRKNLSEHVIIKKLIGTAGTVTTLTAMIKGLRDYNPDLINGTILTRESLFHLSKQILSLPLARRQKLTGLESGRADIITAGIILVQEILQYFSQEALWVSDAGLLEGMILDC